MPDPLPDPSPVIQLIYAFRGSKAMFAAVSMGLFEELEKAPADATTLSVSMHLNASALERLLDACVGLGLASKSGALYSSTGLARTYLLRASPHTLAGYILYSNNVLFPMWGNLESAIREGSSRWQETFHSRGAIFDHFFRTEQAKRDFLMGMNGFGMLSSPPVIRAFDLSRYHHLVDLGGATGHLAIAACDFYPQLRATVFDLPGVIGFTREFFAKSASQDRLGAVAGDFFSGDLPAGDLYAMGRILHDWSEDKVRRLLAKVYAKLPAGGALLIAEKLLHEDKSGPLPALLQSLNMLVCTEGKERTISEYTAILCAAGFSEVQHHITGAPLDAILATKS
jgi:acetylserotonin O-methyltransferase